MSLLFGHPAGNPNAFHAALSHFEAGRLEAFCVPWMPSEGALRLLGCVPGLGNAAQRLARRRFAPLADAPKVQGRAGELRRLVARRLGLGDERLSYEANDWLMRTMRRECARPAVTAVHAYEDCSLWQFEEAKRLGKACIYDMPIGYYPAWEKTQADLARHYADWVPAGGLHSSRYARPEQKAAEMALADLVLVPCRFVEKTIRAFHPDKRLAVAPYGVDLDFWHPPAEKPARRMLRFIYAGQVSLRKGIPLLLAAWEAAALPDAELELVGGWFMADAKRRALPRGVTYSPPCAPPALREKYQAADAFVFPSYFEGFGLVLLEAMACGLPALASNSTAAPDFMTPSSGRIVRTGTLEDLVETLRWFGRERDRLPEMGKSARQQAERCTWEGYRHRVSEAVASLA